MSAFPPELEEFSGRNVVVDTATPLLYVGRLTGADEHFITLEDVDVHDLSTATTSKDVYLIESRKLGIKKNRHKAKVRRDVIVSISLLDDIVEY
ncbi:MAG: hypothetical protein ACYS8W_12480 [Planctomycetota bacterium]|jgi:small nuclear ribonucleoprotein (snRNP)-like protein